MSLEKFHDLLAVKYTEWIESMDSIPEEDDPLTMEITIGMAPDLPPIKYHDWPLQFLSKPLISMREWEQRCIDGRSVTSIAVTKAGLYNLFTASLGKLHQKLEHLDLYNRLTVTSFIGTWLMLHTTRSPSAVLTARKRIPRSSEYLVRPYLVLRPSSHSSNPSSMLPIVTCCSPS